MPKIVVTSSSPQPRFRAGTSFEGAKAFPADHFNAEQLKELIGDRLLTVVVGDVLTADKVDDFIASLPAPKPAKAKAAE